MTEPSSATHPRLALFDPDERAVASLPVCDHYCGIEARMRKSLELQGQLGPVFDVTLDNEDGAPVGGEVEHALLIAEVLGSSANRFGRVGVRLLPVDHPSFTEVAATVLKASQPPAYLMIPKPRGLADLQRAGKLVIDAGGASVPLHALVETHGALAEVHAMAAHPRVESLSFGLLDFVSAHRGAIPLSAMGVNGQFEHPLVVRAKLEIAAACHAHGKVPSHCIVTEFRNFEALAQAAQRAARQLGYTRMWSIHPAQVKIIIEAFAPTTAEVDMAIEIIDAAERAQWAPIRHRLLGEDRLHDRASYRYFWQVLERAQRTSSATGSQLPAEVRERWFT